MPARSGEHTSLLCSPTWKRVATLLVLNREGEPPAGQLLAWLGAAAVVAVTCSLAWCIQSPLPAATG